ncbi:MULTISPECIES: hypothetical protein [Acidiplasma]|jgi:transcriptional antiterminator|uniref:HTH arsR-type domain-containing protein n=2 Tax=Acidiplasma TaxID=507753 RepID=A0A0Q0RLG9_9ARCH|nr:MULTISPECIES: hypothetical protein [Acidiplasma]KJE49601.1 hypothetical protein TZ01_00255 [Acidiplasma sp. MBA-1]KPV46148.1 hypothetical protein SE19_06760 [Acidiplasma aeolicum]KQB33820.1 hypothetical protein AOG54_01695 [Acidiplasma aeolicum]KQB36416.1 hypothetical protein AOG55_04195 [Acidiplasma cupricumulans]WMT55852.1 MAG: MarR family transcriptional regulator [Acidiplasma sp.]
MESGIITELSPSAKLIYKILEEIKVARLCQLMELTGLSRRTILYSVKSLNKYGLIDITTCLSDTRQRFYCLRIK